MGDIVLNVNVVYISDTGKINYHPVPCVPKQTTAEDVCIDVCKHLGIGTSARHLFNLQVTGQKNFLPPSKTFTENLSVEFRVRFKPANILWIKKLDSKAYEYYFHQVRIDLLENKVYNLSYDKHKDALIGLFITDMYRVMIEKEIPRETVEKDYKKYIPKEILKKHPHFFLKKPIKEQLIILQNGRHSVSTIKQEYIKKFEEISPEYLSEIYEAQTEDEGSIWNIFLKISPYHPTEPGISYAHVTSKQIKWTLLCAIEDVGSISAKPDNTLRIERNTGTPFSCAFSSTDELYSFISVVDGYYRLSHKWTFNVCEILHTPSLIKLKKLRCHGPIGGEYAYSKLEAKTGYKHGCYIIRESETKYNELYLDVCVKDGQSPKTFKIEKIGNGEFIFNDDPKRYKLITDLQKKYNNASEKIYLKECLKPSEDDQPSQLLLCRNENSVKIQEQSSTSTSNDALKNPRCINCLDLIVYKCSHVLFDVNHHFVRLARWFSVSSVDSVAHWSFYCAPPDFRAPPPAVLPECALSEEELNYDGTQDVAASGLPCLPWSAKKLLPDSGQVEMLGGNLSAIQAVNYCRDPLKLGQGTFCYVKSLKSKIPIQKVSCQIRKCKSEFCKLAGTGNDFMGIITQTRSNRTCDVWYQSVWEQVDRVVYNDTLFPDIKLGNAKNHCRNPSRNIAGAWCYTTDPEIIMDACNVRDCEKPEECTVITKATNKGHKMYILPQWKEESVHGGIHFSLKEWSADEYDGLSIFVSPWQGSDEIRLDIGAEADEKITVARNGEVVITQTAPHIIKSGSWVDLWLQVRAGEVLLGYEGVPDPFLEYIDRDNKFQPGFLSFSSIHGYPIGIFYDCHECHTELAEEDNFNNTYSFGIWSDTESDMYRNITFNLRGAGLARILLTNLPYSGYKLIIEFNPKKGEIKLNPVYNGIEIEPVTKYARNLYTDLKWSTYFLTFTEYQMELITNETRVFTYTSEAPLIFYWFSVASRDGSVTWSANCPPLDIDGAPRNGGWSEWSDFVCSVTCGGGDGYRYRTCTNPRPNIKGEMCVGEASTTGRCNEFPCGDVSPTTLENIKGNLRREHFSYVVPEDTAVVLENSRQIVKVVARESPKAFFEWTKNGIYIEEQPHHFYNKLDNLQIKHIRHNDSGVYICLLNRINKERVVIRVFTIAVISKEYDVVTRETRKYVLDCTANLLGYVYSDLILKLTINNTLFKEYEIGMLLATINSYSIDRLNKSHHGTWKCVVEQPDLEIEWVTNYVKINVQKAPNLLTNLMEDEMTAPLFAWLKSETNVVIALIFIILFTFGIFIAIVAIYYRFCRLSPRGYSRVKNNYP